MHSSVFATHWNIISVLAGWKHWWLPETGCTKPFAPWLGTSMFEPIWPQRTVQGWNCTHSVKITAIFLTFFGVKQNFILNKLRFCITFHHALLKYAFLYAQIYLFRRKQDFFNCYEQTSTNIIDIDVFITGNWVVTRWQKYSTHLRTNSTQNDTKQTIHRTTKQ